MKSFRNSPIGIIDSGIGGLSMLSELVIKYPNENYIYLADNANMPYGNKGARFITNRVVQLVNYLHSKFDVKLVILACNTASITCLRTINKVSPVQVVGLDLNAYSNCDCKIICTKLSSKKYTDLNTIGLPRLASDIEQYWFDKVKLMNVINSFAQKYQIDEKTIVLGCTHYELVNKLFAKTMPDKKFILPCKEFINQFKINKPSINQKGSVLMISSMPTKSYIDKLWLVFKQLQSKY